MYIKYLLIGLFVSIGWHLGKWIACYLDDKYCKYKHEKKKRKKSDNEKSKRIGFV